MADQHDEGPAGRGATAEQDGSEGDGPGFAAAVQELSRLVAELESDSLDVDDLAQRVARAADLVTWCRARLDETRFRVEEVLVRLEDHDRTPDDLGSDRDASGADGTGP